MSTNWEEIRDIVSTGERPNDWPEGVYSISMDTVSLLGVHHKNNKLYWDGKELVTKSVVRLRCYELILATLAAVGTFGSFAVVLWQALGLFQ